MSIRYKDVEVSGTANTSTIETVLTSSDARQWRIHGYDVVEVTGTEENDAIIEAWIENERFHYYSIKHSLAEHDSETRAWSSYVELGLDLPVGESFRIGHTSGGTASDIRYRVKYEEIE